MQFEIREQCLQLAEPIEGRLMLDASALPGIGVVDAKAEADLLAFLSEWFAPDDKLTVQTSGSTGVPKKMSVSKERMMRSAAMTCSFLDVKQGDVALLCMDLRYIGAKMMVVRSLVCGLRLVVRPATSHPFADVNRHVDFAAIVPMQLCNTLAVGEERARLAGTTKVLVGGGAVDSELERQVQDLPCAVFSTYGMTETLSHVALRRLNGRDASLAYTPLPGVRLAVSDEGTLLIDAPRVCDGLLRTNDLVRLHDDGSFEILGRIDNVINSGGVKIYPEDIEKVLVSYLKTPLAVTSVPDVRLGEMAVLLLLQAWKGNDEALEVVLRRLHPYRRPREVLRVAAVPLTPNGKIDRAACRKLAAHLMAIS